MPARPAMDVDVDAGTRQVEEELPPCSLARNAAKVSVGQQRYQEQKTKAMAWKRKTRSGARFVRSVYLSPRRLRIHNVSVHA